jgi:hypothetical protein
MVVALSRDQTADTLARQGRLLQAELQARGQEDLKAPVDLYLRHITQFRESGRSDRGSWLADIEKTLRS